MDNEFVTCEDDEVDDQSEEESTDLTVKKEIKGNCISVHSSDEVDDQAGGESSYLTFKKKIKGSVHNSGFRDFHLKPEILRVFVEQGFKHPSTVRHKCIPKAILGYDILCKYDRKKTAVFVVATLQQLEPVTGQVSVLVLCPCRESAGQVWDKYKLFSKYMADVKVELFHDGCSIKEDEEILEINCPHIMVGTTSRIFSLARNKSNQALNLKHIKHFILHGCDIMLEQPDFLRDIQEIFSQTPQEKQVMMFCTTLNKEILPIRNLFLRDAEGCGDLSRTLSWDRPAHPVEGHRKRRKSLRDSFVKDIKEDDGKSSDGSGKKKKHAYSEELSFLQDIRPTSGNGLSDDSVSQTESVIDETSRDVLSPNSSGTSVVEVPLNVRKAGKRRKKQTDADSDSNLLGMVQQLGDQIAAKVSKVVQPVERERQDEIYYFCRSLDRDMRRIPPEKLHTAKFQITCLVNNFIAPPPPPTPGTSQSYGNLWGTPNLFSNVRMHLPTGQMTLAALASVSASPKLQPLQHQLQNPNTVQQSNQNSLPQGHRETKWDKETP